MATYSNGCTIHPPTDEYPRTTNDLDPSALANRIHELRKVDAEFREVQGRIHDLANIRTALIATISRDIQAIQELIEG